MVFISKLQKCDTGCQKLIGHQPLTKVWLTDASGEAAAEGCTVTKIHNTPGGESKFPKQA
ncbi:MAG: hypothetical protein KME26_31505 [Oscillatoria princeps RMCB-10]|nr:hypothetical protein [Oscillatoria princeps RMCB-10]